MNVICPHIDCLQIPSANFAGFVDRFFDAPSLCGIQDYDFTLRRDLLGHSPEDITDDYTHSTIESRRRAVELLCQTPIENLAEFQIKSGKSLASVAV